MKLKDIIEKHKITTISEKLKIPQTTLRRWIRNEQLTGHIKFIELLIYLDIDIKEFIEDYKKKNEPWN